MQPSVRETSIAAYHELRDDGKLTAKQQQITDELATPIIRTHGDGGRT